MSDALAVMGVPAGGEIPPGILEALGRAAGEVAGAARASLLFKAARIKYTSDTEIHANGFRIQSAKWAQVVSSMEDPGYACVLALTLGEGLDEKIATLSAESLHRAFLWDALASSLVSNLISEAADSVTAWFEEKGRVTTRHFSPGYCDWPLGHGQRELFSFCRPERIGMRVSESDLMSPRKSVTAVVLSARRTALQTPCPLCRRECAHRRSGIEEAKVGRGTRIRDGFEPGWVCGHVDHLTDQGAFYYNFTIKYSADKKLSQDRYNRVPSMLNLYSNGLAR